MLDENLNNKIKEIIKDVPYQKLILFGSYSRGTNTKNSDIDLLLVTKKEFVMRQKMELAKKIRKQFANNRMDVDIIIKNEKELKEFKNRCGSLVYHAIKEGVVL